MAKAKRKPQAIGSAILPENLPALLRQSLREGSHHPVSLLMALAEVIASEAGEIIDTGRKEYVAGRDDSWTYNRERSSKETVEACLRGDYLTPLQIAALEAIERAWPDTRRQTS